jgi:DNA-binding MarR family transcriptional regulator
LVAESKIAVQAISGDDFDPANNYILWGLLLFAHSTMGRVRDLELADIGVTPEQSGALFLLARNGKATIGEMAEAWCRQRNSVSTLMERMAKQGLVKKVKVPKQRGLEIHITTKGRQMHDRIVRNGQVFNMVFGRFSGDERQEFARCLRIVLKGSQELMRTGKLSAGLRPDDPIARVQDEGPGING